MPLGSRMVRSRIPAWRAALAVALLAAPACLAWPASSLASPVPGSRPSLTAASSYLTAPSNLIAGHYYQSFPQLADFGLTIDGALALAATGDENPALRRIVAFLDDAGKDASGKTVNTWTGIGTRYASGGAIGKEALLAEVVGDNPRRFGGHNLIAALNALVCQRASAGSRCAAAGSFAYATSVFDQALGILAQLRAGQARQAAAPVAYLESLRNADGSFPSLIPAGGSQDVDSTAMAVMALALVPGGRAAADVSAGLNWIAGQQEPDGGFPGAGGDSVNSAALAVQAMTLRRASFGHDIAAALAFLAGQQNSDGGFNADAHGQRGSNLRASAQAVSGTAGASYGTLRRHLSRRPGGGVAARVTADLGPVILGLAVIGALVTMLLRRRRRSPGPPAAGRPHAGAARGAGS
jgi:Prenyltransferase and squalene oxidase repeat